MEWLLSAAAAIMSIAYSVSTIELGLGAARVIGTHLTSCVFLVPYFHKVDVKISGDGVILGIALMGVAVF